jgi:D-amino-acid dehydrogenase
MAELKADVVVLGAGMVGVGAALHLQQRGRDVMLVDRHELAGEETSYGNAGMIECASVFPYMFPRDFAQLLQYALNRAPQAHYRASDVPAFLPWLVRYFLASSLERALHSAMAELPLIRRSLIEHEALRRACRSCCDEPAGSSCFAPKRRLPPRSAISIGRGPMVSTARYSMPRRSRSGSPI